MRALTAVLLCLLAGVQLAAQQPQTLVIHTNAGDIEAELLPDVAPLFVRRLETLIEVGAFRDSVRLHFAPGYYLVIEPAHYPPGFRNPVGNEIDAADLGLETQTVRRSWQTGLLPSNDARQNGSVAALLRSLGYRFDSSLHSLPHSFGMLSTYNEGPGGNFGGFFIVLSPGPAPWLDGRYTVFGRVNKGESLLRAWAAPGAGIPKVRSISLR